MEQSESINELAAALSSFQGNCPNISRDSMNDKGKNASLDQITKITRPLLSKEGLSFIQICENLVEETSIVNLLMHKSGQWIRSTMIIPSEPPRLSREGKKMMNDTQAVGSSITYARRYGMMSFLGIAQEDDPCDDDGHKASYNRDNRKIVKPTTAPSKTYTAEDYKTAKKVINGTEKVEKVEAETLSQINGLIASSNIPGTVIEKWKNSFRVTDLSQLTKQQGPVLLNLVANYIRASGVV